MAKILIVDDEVNIRNLCYEVFSQEGYDVTAVATGQDVFTMIQAEKPDLIIMDFHVPGEEGFSLFKSLPNQKENRIPVILYSGAVTQELEKQAFELGISEVVSKGGDILDLKNKVKKILKDKEKKPNESKEIIESKTEEISDSVVRNENKILIVDDESAIRILLKDFFEKRGYEVILAENGEMGVQTFKQHKPAMVLLDVTMPGMDGIMTLKKLKQIDPEVGVVMATGIQDESVACEATREGAYAYVLKPFDMKYLDLVVMTRLMMSC